MTHSKIIEQSKIETALEVDFSENIGNPAALITPELQASLDYLDALDPLDYPCLQQE